MNDLLVIMLLRIVFDGLRTPTCEHTEDYAVTVFEALWPNTSYLN